MILADRVTPKRRVTFFAVLGFGLLLSAFFLYAFVRIHDDISHPRLEALDHAILEGIHAYDTPFLTHLAKTLSFIGSPLTLIPVILAASAILWRRKHKRDALLILLSMLGGGSLDTVLKLHYRRIRPDLPWVFIHEHSFSFPSGHSVMAVVLYGTITYLLWQYLRDGLRRAGILCASALLVAGIGLSRIYLGVHYPSDVLGGYIIGGLWLLFVMAADWTIRRDEPVRDL